jgi:hypothetical protein
VQFVLLALKCAEPGGFPSWNLPEENTERTMTAALAADERRGSPPEDTEPNVGSIFWCWADSGVGGVGGWLHYG